MYTPSESRNVSLPTMFAIEVPKPQSQSANLLQDDLTKIFQWIILAVICQAIDVFGVATNIINIICFLKQGFKDPVNVSLLGLSISDLGCVATLIWTNICLTPAFSAADLPFDATEIQYLTGAMPHATFTRVTSWITAFITLERCLCITVPLKVKYVITSKRVAIITVCMFVCLIVSAVPVYLVNRLDIKFYNTRNKTLIGLIYSSDREMVEKIAFAINNTSIPFCAFAVIIICTTTLVIKLRSKAKWRHMSTCSNQADKISNRNQQVAKMVVVISSLFIFSFVPISVIFIAMSLEPELSIGGKYSYLLILIGGFGTILESLNSSINIFIYYSMSSKYREVLIQIFKLI